MITIIHGEDTVKSRLQLESFSKQIFGNTEKMVFDGKKLSLRDFRFEYENSSLLGEKRLFIIENLFNNTKEKEVEKIFELISKDLGDIEFILWNEGEIPAGKLKKIKSAKVFLFKLPSIIFQFLDNIRPKNTEEMLLSIHRCIDSSKAEIIFTMIVRQFRLLILVKTGTDKSEDLSRLAPWQKAKLEKQAAFFDLEQLVKSYNNLLQIDASQKNGKATLNLPSALDLFLINL